MFCRDRGPPRHSSRNKESPDERTLPPPQGRCQELERANGFLRRECEDRAHELSGMSAAKLAAEKQAASLEVRLRALEASSQAKTTDWEQAGIPAARWAWVPPNP